MPSRTRPDCLIEQGVATARRPMPEPDLAAFYDEVFLPLVRRATWRYGLTKEDAKDVVQDAFLLAIEKIDSARNPKAWLIQVVDHLALNHQRKLQRRARLLARWEARGGEFEFPNDERRSSDAQARE
jgi:DNA-directed RNA polymerase specialized sigma24 family protein